MVNGDQELWLTTSIGVLYSVVDEGDGIYRLQTTPQAHYDVMLHAIQVGPANGSAVNVSITSQDANAWTITFTSASWNGNSCVREGCVLTRGSFGYAVSGTPRLPL